MKIVEIDKNALIQNLTECAENFEENGYYRDGAVELVKRLNWLIADIPTIEKEIHAKWTDRYKNGYKPPNVVICTHCNWFSYEKDAYCQRCGAKMDLQTEK